MNCMCIKQIVFLTANCKTFHHQLCTSIYLKRKSQVCVYECIDCFSNDTLIDLYFRIRVLLHRAQKDFEAVCDLRTGVSQCRPAYINMPWTDLIMACVDFKISGVDFTEPDSKVINMDNFNHIS